MKCPPFVATDAERLEALSKYSLGSVEPLASLAPVVKTATRVFRMPMSAVNMIGSNHVFLTASTGFEEAKVDLSRDVSFCAHTITQQGVMVVRDTANDERFYDNPLVTGSPGLRFYAGVPLLSPDGHAVGVFCVMDRQPHPDFSAEDCEQLRELAKMAADRLELRRIEVAAQKQLTQFTPAVVEDRQRGLREAISDSEPPLATSEEIDALTLCLSRDAFYGRVDDMLTRGLPAAIVILDIDGFKDINATLGAGTGDDVLRELARRLRDTATEDDTVARISGDQFGVLLPVGDSEQKIKACVEFLSAKVTDKLCIDRQEIPLSMTAGVAIAPIHGQDALKLISNADLALTRAKTSCRGRAYVFENTLHKEAVARRLYTLELHRAVTAGQFELFYQPQFRLVDGALSGAEALIRWRHPQHGLLLPAAFVPALEMGSLAVSAGAWILDEACAQAARWQRSGAKDFRIGVNLFTGQLQLEDFVAQVLSTLKRHGLAPQALELEVTENIALDGNGSVLESLQDLRHEGVSLAFDDFGTGYASLSTLRRFPVSRIKIDRTFVQHMVDSTQDASVVRALLAMADSFGLQTTAEGIESEAQREMLRQLGCQEGQGYLFGRPIPALQFAKTFGFSQVN
ncbi:sensor domain-containing phosphodiesterase [Cupriavidus pinatubonensis]|uniref:sensor domain-containing phosphodiesterase n=1 Tax=Cupriavidus pinatubonensis TaxID=248026 RepID=UPI00112D77F1|nr:sensor domain-containing phosphodiesterase [Cupriavidus pinatubonensis]TPQ32296.1 diguanylate cyclase [Cupriavidus pinatubonensis]